ncbi:MAG: hypothetical protein ABI155_11975 [Paralcaligenes sp.]
MTTQPLRHPIRMAVLAYLVLLAPPLRHILESSMTAQMLLQIPLLIGVGLLLPQALPTRVLGIVAKCNYQGISGLLLASIVSAFWMLPLALDASVADPVIAALKYLSVPLLIGVPLALSWPHMGFIVRGVFLLELTATFFRLGWLYLVWPGRLCNNYLLDDQQQLGQYMLWIGGALLLGIMVKLLWGRFDSE